MPSKLAAALRIALDNGANLAGADLAGADLYGADLREANLREVNLAGADLRRAYLFGSTVSHREDAAANTAPSTAHERVSPRRRTSRSAVRLTAPSASRRWSGSNRAVGSIVTNVRTSGSGLSSRSAVSFVVQKPRFAAW